MRKVTYLRPIYGRGVGHLGLGAGGTVRAASNRDSSISATEPSRRSMRRTPSDQDRSMPRTSVADGPSGSGSGRRERTLTRAPTSAGVIRTTYLAFIPASLDG